MIETRGSGMETVDFELYGPHHHDPEYHQSFLLRIDKAPGDVVVRVKILDFNGEFRLRS
jgi:hypothetical protein